MSRKFYYDTGKEKGGPVSGFDLLKLRRQGVINDATWVKEGKSSTWRQLAAVDLSKEEDEVANPSLLHLLTHHFSLSTIIILVAVLAVLLVLFIGLFWVARPFFLLAPVLWLLSRSGSRH